MTTTDMMARCIARQRQVIEGQRAEIVRLSMKLYEIQKIIGERTSPSIVSPRAQNHA